MPQVSILMCVYNGETHLREAIESILNQTLQDFEFIIVNDGSTDSTLSIIQHYQGIDSRIKLIENEINLGLEKSLNKGLQAVTGEYFARQDADDVSLPTRLEQQVHYLTKYPEVGAIGTAVESINQQGDRIGQDVPPTDHDALEALFLFNNFMHHSTLMARFSLIQAIGGYDATQRRAEDYDLWWRLSQQAKVANLPEILLKRRLDDAPRISTIYRKDQLHCSYAIAVRSIQTVMPKPLAEASYQKLWWALLEPIDRTSYEQYWHKDQGLSGDISQADIQALRNFWDFLIQHPGGQPSWGPMLEKLVWRLLIRQKTIAALSLLKICLQLHHPINWFKMGQYFLKPYLPVAALGLWKEARLSMSSVSK
ncbi:MAG: hypothetical protein B0A82_16725 [Alkalinema sp. CACIAM 70d]|nr:MAG: hypothetical protein B0A82_16725 [Alkalinema sp. CACIAM 70d]